MLACPALPTTAPEGRRVLGQGQADGVRLSQFGNWEMEVSGGQVAEQIRPTGVLDPIVEVRPTTVRLTTCSVRSETVRPSSSGCW